VHGWTTENRYIRPLASHYAGGDGSDGQAYHGLDFQLLHNLYYLVTPSAWDLGGAGDTDAGVPGVADAGAPGSPDSGLPDAAPDAPDATIGGGQNDDGCGCGAAGDGDEIPGALFIGILLLFAMRRSQ
jgi:MYXO-CTERM domain-containing protein